MKGKDLFKSYKEEDSRHQQKIDQYHQMRQNLVGCVERVTGDATNIHKINQCLIENNMLNRDQCNESETSIEDDLETVNVILQRQILQNCNVTITI